ncbi:hypothetical protein FOH10_09135 [Nocardia otitidiscaviarum]|uniref:Uncharacterized protein n=1 Tax=Nocardia otitidiscaviarum TaxID=1823 RepID=A0A516NIZ1_9NOCA|nr:hypothetical protein [Nocardia otitidiscaviarum]MCP9619680.1 hypothetical protein [Nocardia otitidiscaviarum]QDP78877.1 hypothetical protein FOH10_09135 [Nocardia otitidiscaviarum]
MTTSEQRVRARKTRIPEQAAAGQGVKPSRSRKVTPKDIPATWRCEGQLSLFDRDGGERDA